MCFFTVTYRFLQIFQELTNIVIFLCVYVICFCICHFYFYSVVKYDFTIHLDVETLKELVRLSSFKEYG